MKSSACISTQNCWKTEAWPLSGCCQIVKVVYKATLWSNQPTYQEKVCVRIGGKSCKAYLCSQIKIFLKRILKNQ